MSGIREQLRKALGEAPGTVLLTNFAFILILVLIWKLTSRLSPLALGVTDIWTNRMIALIGGLLGWVVGSAFAPYSDADRAAFRSIGTAVSAFLSGYVVSKLDHLLDQVVSQETPVVWVRLGLFTATFLLIAITVFINRFYAFSAKPADMPVSGTPPAGL